MFLRRAAGETTTRSLKQEAQTQLQVRRISKLVGNQHSWRVADGGMRIANRGVLKTVKVLQGEMKRVQVESEKFVILVGK